MPNILFPIIGTQIRLTKDWTFKLFEEHRNESLLAFYKDAIFQSQEIQKEWAPNNFYTITEKHTLCTLLKGTVLQVDRIYLRKGVKDFDSITFLIADYPDPKYLPGKGGKRIRFWAKITCINNVMQGVFLDEPIKLAKVK